MKLGKVMGLPNRKKQGWGSEKRGGIEVFTLFKPF